MKIRSKQNNLEHQVSEETWKKMQENGSAKRYTVISSEPPKEVKELMQAVPDKSIDLDAKKAVAHIEKLSLEEAKQFAFEDTRKSVLDAISKKEEIDNNEKSE